MNRRIEMCGGLLLVLLVLLCVRAVDLQYFQADALAAKAEQQRLRNVTIEAPRGGILDQKGRVLAESLEAVSIAAVGNSLSKQDVASLAGVLGMRASDLRKKLGSNKGFRWLTRQTSPGLAEDVALLDLPGISLHREWKRFYPYGPEAGHVTGFVGVDGHGLEGMEYGEDTALAGKPGTKQFMRDARGRVLPDAFWLNEPQPGSDVHLYLDANIQSLAYAALADGVELNHARSGSIVVLRPSDGAVLAMVNWPGYNPNNFRSFKPSQWRNRAITDVFEPGSVLKPFTTAAALMSDRWTSDSILFCENGAYEVADYVIHDDHPSGWLSVAGVLAKSSNIGATKLAQDIGPEALWDTVSQSGFGRSFGLGLPGESRGILHGHEDWGPVELATIGFGQGIAVTSLQLAVAFGVLANHGQLVEPKLIQKKEQALPVRVMPAHIADDVMGMLELAASDEGTGKLAVPPGYVIAGKTGTAQKPDENGKYSDDLYTAVFAGIAPAENPKLVVVVMVDEPQKSIYGGQVAAPVFRSFVEQALPYLGVLPKQNRGLMLVSNPSGLRSEIQADVAGVVPSMKGWTLREVRRYAAESGISLTVHGSGWVSRQTPTPHTTLASEDGIEVWLNG